MMRVSPTIWSILWELAERALVRTPARTAAVRTAAGERPGRTVCWCVLLVALWPMGATGAAEAEPQYYMQPLDALQLNVKDFPNDANGNRLDLASWNWDITQSRVALDGPGEAYMVAAYNGRAEGDPEWMGTARLVVKSPGDKEVSGILFLVPNDYGVRNPPARVRFSVPREQGSPEWKEAFYITKCEYYERLRARDIPGAAWFRHQANAASRAIGWQHDAEDGRTTMRRTFGRNRRNDFENTFALVSGGRAVSENLQLDRQLPRAKPENALSVPIEQIQGITVKEFDWSSYINGIDPAVDSLAAWIPHDQYAIFFPSFAAVLDMIDHAEAQGTPVLRAAEPRAENARTRERYQRQLCLPLGRLERLFGHDLVREAALTGGDPYFRTGTDVAVLLASNNPEALQTTIAARMTLALQAGEGAEAVQGQVRGIDYRGVRTTDRSICAYLATLRDTVIVTNSLVQLERILSVAQAEQPSLGSLDEYRFFRHRYPRGSENETALLLVSDATIRRWCGPRWRIATSRRTRAVAMMSEIQAEQLDHLVAGKVESRTIPPDWWVPGAEQFTITDNGVQSELYGTLEFQTPISELEITHVSEEEKRFYEVWRNGYQRYWSNFFDPIAISFHASKDQVAIDMTVMPLIDFSDYRTFVDASKGGKLQAEDVDLHADALVHASLALDRESATLKQFATVVSGIAPQIRVDPLRWLGDAIAVYADKDPFWEQVAAAEDPDEFIEKNWYRLPLALHIDVRDGFQLTAFLVGLRGFVEQSSPDMLLWETRQHRDRSYVRVAPSPTARADNEYLEQVALYYAASGSQLVFSLNEDVLKRAIDRQLDDKAAAGAQGSSDDGPGQPDSAQPPVELIGQNLNVLAGQGSAQVVATILEPRYRSAMQRRAWASLPILNEWRRRYPDHDPVALHEQYWQVELVCPGGGTYRWNEPWQTMESTAYGHPAEPKDGPGLPPVAVEFERGAFGLTFEKNGLRSRAILTRAKAD